MQDKKKHNFLCCPKFAIMKNFIFSFWLLRDFCKAVKICFVGLVDSLFDYS